MDYISEVHDGAVKLYILFLVFFFSFCSINMLVSMYSESLLFFFVALISLFTEKKGRFI